MILLGKRHLFETVPMCQKTIRTKPGRMLNRRCNMRASTAEMQADKYRDSAFYLTRMKISKQFRSAHRMMSINMLERAEALYRLVDGL